MIRILLSMVSIACLLSSCMIYEDIHFTDNGTIKYNLAIDMSQMMQQGVGDVEFEDNNNLFEGKISLAQMLRDSIQNTEDLTEEHLQIIEDLEPFYLETTIDEEGNESIYNVSGDFADINQFNRGLTALGTWSQFKDFMATSNDEDSEDNYELAQALERNLHYVWDGRKMIRNSQYIKEEDEMTDNQALEESEGVIDLMMSQLENTIEQMLGMGKYVTRYHFDKPIKSVSIQYDEISDDKKSITIEQPGTAFIKSEIEDIIVEIDR